MVDNQLDADFSAAFAPAPTPAAAPVSVATPSAPMAPVNVYTPDGQIKSIPGEQLGDALQDGYREASDDEVNHHFMEEKYGTSGQQLKTGLEGAASAATFGLSTGIETALGVSPEDIRNRRETNPVSHGAGQMAGLAGSALIPGLGEANAAKALEVTGELGVKAAGLAAAESTAAKIGSAAVKGMIENSAFQAGDEVSKMFTRDPAQNIGTAAADVGLAGLLGGVIGGGVGAATPLWQATVGKETQGTIQAIADRLGGIEGDTTTAVDGLLSKAGMDVQPEIRSALSNDPNLQAAALHLSQSDTTGAGRAFQQSMKDFHGSAQDSLISALGKTPDAVESVGQTSKYEVGKSLGKSLADEFAEKVDPVAAEYDKFRSRYKNVPLEASVQEKATQYEAEKAMRLRDLAKATREAQDALSSGNPAKALESAERLEEAKSALLDTNRAGRSPGTIDQISQKINELAVREGWTQSQSSEQMGLIKTILKELPEQKTLEHLNNYISLVGDKANRDMMNFPLKRAGQMIKGVMKDAEAEVLSRAVGEKEGGEAVAALSKARENYAKVSKIKEAIDDRLHVKGSTSRYAKALREAANTDGEAILRKLSTSGDADLLNVLTGHFPRTAEKVKDFHLNNILEQGVNKAKNGQKINPEAVRNAVNKMSPELRSMVFSPEAAGKIDAIGELLNRMKNPNYNFSNTARTVDKLTAHIPGGVAGLVTALTTGHLGTGMAVAQGFGAVTKSLPDAMRLSLLKFLGTAKPIDAPAFASLVQSMQATVRGENAVLKGVKNVFSAAEKGAVSTIVSLPSDKERAKLDKMVVESQTNPAKFQTVGTQVGYYAPEHGMGIAQTGMNALQFLNSQRPDTTPKMPLDSKLPPEPGKMANYNRMLDIAQKPLVILNKIKTGSITPNEIVGLKAMYPGLYDNMVSKLTNEMNDHMAKGNPIPYTTRTGLSMFAHMPLDSTMTPSAIVAAQPKPKQQEQMPGGPVKPPSQGSVKGLGKMATGYQTADQTRQQRAESK